MSELSGADVSNGLVDVDSLERLVVRVAAGDGTALAQLHTQTSNRVLATVKAVLRDHAASEEVAQEVYVQLWQRTASTFDAARGRAWPFLLSVARRRAIDRVRLVESQRRHDTIMGEKVSRGYAIDMADVSLTRIELDSALYQLAEQPRNVIALYYFLGHSYAEIAQVLAMPVGTVKSHHHRALAALRRAHAFDRGRDAIASS